MNIPALYLLHRFNVIRGRLRRQSRISRNPCHYNRWQKKQRENAFLGAMTSDRINPVRSEQMKGHCRQFDLRSVLAAGNISAVKLQNCRLVRFGLLIILSLPYFWVKNSDAIMFSRSSIKANVALQVGFFIGALSVLLYFARKLVLWIKSWQKFLRFFLIWKPCKWFPCQDSTVKMLSKAKL